jgi:hypothetical protein
MSGGQPRTGRPPTRPGWWWSGPWRPGTR